MSDESDLLASAVGGGGIVAAVIAIFKWLGGRMVQREDEDKKALQAKVEEGQKAERSIERTLIGLQHDVNGLRADLANIGRQVENRAAAQDKEITELRVEFKEELRLLEHRMKGDVQRIVSASLPPRGKGRA